MGVPRQGLRGLGESIDDLCTRLLTKAALASAPVTAGLVALIDRSRTRTEIEAVTRSRIREIQAVIAAGRRT